MEPVARENAYRLVDAFLDGVASPACAVDRENLVPAAPPTSRPPANRPAAAWRNDLLMVSE
jgi:hypothetical protein